MEVRPNLKPETSVTKQQFPDFKSNMEIGGPNTIFPNGPGPNGPGPNGPGPNGPGPIKDDQIINRENNLDKINSDNNFDSSTTAETSNNVNIQEAVEDDSGNTETVPSSAIVVVPTKGSTDSQTDSQTNTNNMPVANAGPNIITKNGEKVVLNGNNSYDPEGNPLSYLWLQLAGGPMVNMSDIYSVNPSFDAPSVTENTTLTFMLLVNDGSLNGNPSYTYVTVEP